MILTTNVHYSRASDVVVPDNMQTDPPVAITAYRDGFGNWCSRMVAPAGRMRIYSTGVVADSGIPDVVAPDAAQHDVADLPEETLVFLLGSRYCETDLLTEAAWRLFGETAPGWARVQAICDFVHHHIAFDYQQSRPTRTAWEAFNERTGVCRDYASRRRVLPMPEYSGAVLHRIPERHRYSAAVRDDGSGRVVRRVFRGPMVYVRRAQ